MKKLLAPLGAIALLLSVGVPTLAQTTGASALKTVLVAQDKMGKKPMKKAPAKKPMKGKKMTKKPMKGKMAKKPMKGKMTGGKMSGGKMSHDKMSK